MTHSAEARVVVLSWRLGPYHHARLNAAGRALRIVGMEACGIEEMYGWSKVEGAENFSKVTLTERFLKGSAWTRRMRLNLWNALDRIQPDVVAIPGWSMVDALAGLYWCVRTSTAVVVMSDSTAWSADRHHWKEWLKSRLLKNCSSAFVAGIPHAEYLVDLGMPRDRIFLGYDAVDNDYFAQKTADIRKRALEIRAKHELPETYFLVSARFVEVKNLPRLLEAYAKYRELFSKAESRKQKAEMGREERQEPWDLVVLGDGPLRQTLNSQLSPLKLQDSVQMPGFKQYDELPTYYALAQAVILPSTSETWGLVINEAMASGLPVLVSNRCGCAQDLVKEGVNGFTFDPYDVDQLANLMLRMSAVDCQLSAFGDASRRIISDWGLSRFAMGLKQAVESALHVRPRRPGLCDRALLRASMYRGRYA